jgi:hypothetical protein
MERDNIWVSRSELVESNLANMNVALSARLGLSLHQALDGIRFGMGRVGVHRTVNNAITANAQDLDELKSAGVNESTERRVSGLSGSHVLVRH